MTTLADEMVKLALAVKNGEMSGEQFRVAVQTLAPAAAPPATDNAAPMTPSNLSSSGKMTCHFSHGSGRSIRPRFY
jgi:hypothetical protein